MHLKPAGAIANDGEIIRYRDIQIEARAQAISQPPTPNPMATII
jgi:hypothetical protein